MQKTKTIDIGNSNASAFREHQKAAFELAQQIAAGRFTSKKIFANVTPGGGKTGLASILIHELFRQGIIDRVLYVVPRVALRSQVIQSFCNDSKFNPSGYQIESAGYGPLYTEPQIGCVATYGELALKQNLIAEWAQAGRALIIFDEAHLLSKEDDSQGWAKACEFIASPARLVLAMTGTAERHDGKPIAFATYETNHATMRKFAKFDIQYTLREAIKDSAVAQPEFVRIDGRVEVAIGGKLFKGELSAAEKEKERLMLRAAICRPEFVRGVIDQAIRHWEGYRRDGYRSRMLVIADDQESAKAIRKYLTEKWKAWRAALAISDDDDNDPHIELENFRLNSSADILVTCNMASIGFDVPDLTHCVYLKTWRSRPEFQQAIARAMRVNYRCSVSPDNQRAFIFTPDDPRMVDLVEEIRNETTQGVKDRAEPKPNEGGSRTPNAESTFQPIRCDVLGTSLSTLDQNFSEDETWKIEAVRHYCGEPSLPEHVCLKLYSKHPEDYPRVIHGPNTPGARKHDLRSKNQDAVTELGKLRQAQTTAPTNHFQEINAQLKAKFGRSPEEMSEAQLDSRLKTVQDLIRKERQALSLNGARTHAR